MIRKNPLWQWSCLVCERVREILVTAPWSIFDLLGSLIISGIGLYLLLNPTLFQHIGGVYQSLANWGNERIWGTLFLLGGSFGFVVCIWIVRLSFYWRLMARMVVAFCLLSLVLNNLNYPMPPLSTVTYGVLGIAALWSILRTKANGR